MARILKLMHPELFFDLLILILGIVITIISWRYGLGALKRPGPGLYPFLIAVFLILPFSTILVISALKSEKNEALFGKHGFREFLLMTLAFILWIGAMPYLGYVIVTLVATFCFCKVMKLEGWLKPLALSVGTALFIYILFDYWLYIDLPRGILG
jgi:putative tricarboxylic transport membrane protein